jgi:hypothetical protein
MTAWIQEFQDTLQSLDRQAAELAKPSATGALNVTVANGDSVTDGWQLSVNGTTRLCHGRTAGIGNLKPATYTVRVVGKIDGREKASERAVNVPSGPPTEVDITIH